jgi:TolB-like protein
LIFLLVVTVLAADAKPKLAVLDVQTSGVEATLGVALGDAITQELTRRDFFDVISSGDIRALLGIDRQKQLLGCGDSSCTAELSGALGARFVMQSQLTKLGDALQLSLQMLDTTKAQTVARSVRLARDAKTLAEQLPWALAEATATPLPPSPSRALPWTLVGVGAASLAAGGIIGIDALSRDAAVASELAQGATGIFKPRSAYQSEIDLISRNKTISVVALAAGAVLLGAGILLFPPDTGVRVALGPTANGAVLAGVLP